MTRLDENRAKAQLAKKAGADIAEVSNLAVWGNHSPTMFPDFYHAKIRGQAATEAIADENWLKTEFVTTVAQRGTSVLNARKAGSAASAANAALDTVKSIITPTPAGDWHSVCVCSDGSYGIDRGLICSFAGAERRAGAERGAGAGGERIRARENQRVCQRIKGGKGHGPGVGIAALMDLGAVKK